MQNRGLGYDPGLYHVPLDGQRALSAFNFLIQIMRMFVTPALPPSYRVDIRIKGIDIKIILNFKMFHKC